MPSSSGTQSTVSYSGTGSGNSTSSNGSYVHLNNPGHASAGAGAHAHTAGHQTSGTAHHHVHSASATATGGGHSGTGAATYGSAAAGGHTVISVFSSSSSTVSGKDGANSDHDGFPTDASDEENARNGKTTKAKKHGSKKHLSIDNVYTMGGKDSYGKAQVGSGSGAPTGCSLM